MMSYQTIVHVKDPEGGFPGVPNLFGQEGVPVQVPEDEVRDATLLAEDLLRDMAAS
jgi:hypothetical protein